jgi:DNA-binding MarR family transcriptional regulator
MTTTDLNLQAALQRWIDIFMRHTMHDLVQLKREAGLSMSQLSTLFRLFHAQECGVSDIGESLGVTSAAASQMVDRLVGLDYLTRSEDPQDRRVKVLSLTEKGHALIQESYLRRQEWLAQITASLSTPEQESISEALTLLTEAAIRLGNMDYKEHYA